VKLAVKKLNNLSSRKVTANLAPKKRNSLRSKKGKSEVSHKETEQFEQ
jgi:hypothetical protein